MNRLGITDSSERRDTGVPQERVGVLVLGARHVLDPEARGNTKCEPTYGKLREPVLFLTHLFRALECTGGMWGIAQLSRGMGQNVFSPPSVFNFYQPDFRIVAAGREGDVGIDPWP